jgi:ABC-type glycerol-3-phosphate transport system substrate-binding protein
MRHSASQSLSRRHVLRWVGLVAGAGAAAVALTACGGGATVAASTSVAATSTAAAPSVATTAPVTTATTATTAAKAAVTTASATTTSAKAATSAAAAPTPAVGETRKGAATTVELWLNWGGDVQASMQGLADAMAKQLPDFNVAWLTSSGNATKLPAAIAAGTPPDVASGGVAYPEFWAKGAATPIDDLLAKSNLIDKSDIPAPAWLYASYKGKTYGVPGIEAFTRYGLLLDMTNLEKFGVDAKTLSWDWDTLMQLQQQATVKDGAGNIQVLGIDPLSEDATFGACSFFAQAWGTQYFDEKTFTYNFDNTQLAEAMTKVKKLYDLVGGPAAVDKWRKQNAQWVASTKAAIPAGTQNMSIIGYFAPAQVADFAPNRQFAFTWPAVPASKKGYKFQTVGSHNLLIPAGSKHVPEAFQLMGFLIGDTAEQVLFDHSGFLGARLSFLKKVDTSKYPGLDFYFQSVQNADNVGGPLPDPVQSFSATTWTSTLNNVLAGKAQPADALKQLQQQVTTEYHQRFPNG